MPNLVLACSVYGILIDILFRLPFSRQLWNFIAKFSSWFSWSLYIRTSPQSIFSLDIYVLQRGTENMKQNSHAIHHSVLKLCVTSLWGDGPICQGLWAGLVGVMKISQLFHNFEASLLSNTIPPPPPHQRKESFPVFHSKVSIVLSVLQAMSLEQFI